MTSVAILGTGVMGSAMARNAARAGVAVRAWSRPLSDAERLAADDVAVCATPAEACTGAQLVVTMVPDAAAIESFAEEMLAAMEPGAVWIQSSTVGVAPADRLVELAAARGVAFVDAPVLGSKAPAEAGELVMLASGEHDDIARCGPFFDAVARRVLVLGEAGRGSRLKMVTNAWIMSAVAAIAESVALAESLGLDGHTFADALSGTPMDMGYVQIKGPMMAERAYPVQISLANGLKDAALALEAARAAGLPARVATAAADMFGEAIAAGLGAEDVAAAVHAALQTTTTGELIP